MRSWSPSFRQRVEQRRKEERMRIYWTARCREIENEVMDPVQKPALVVTPTWTIPFRGLREPGSFRA